MNATAADGWATFDLHQPPPLPKERRMHGTFWLSGNPAQTRSGDLDLDLGHLETQGELVDCMVTTDAAPDFYRRTPLADDDIDYRIFGELSDGRLVTIPAAARGRCDDKVEPVPQEFVFTQAMLGAHVVENDTFDTLSVRWPVRLGGWVGDLDISAIGTVRMTTDGQTLVVDELPDLTATTALRRVLEPFNTLLATMTGRPALPHYVELANSAGTTVTAHWPSRDRTTRQSNAQGFFDHTRLKVTHLNLWFAMVSKTHPILSVAARALNGNGTTLEAQIMTLAAVAEGLHEQLHGQRALDRATVKNIRKAVEQVVPVEHRARADQALARLGAQSFRDRLEWLTANLEPLSSELCGADTLPVGGEEDGSREAGTKAPKTARTHWVNTLMHARNNFAHQNTENPEDLDDYVKHRFVLCGSAKWFVVACILRDLGISVPDITQEFGRRDAYHRFRGRAHRAFPEIYRNLADYNGAAFTHETDYPEPRNASETNTAK